LIASSCALARCSRLFTAAVDDPIASATSAAFHCSTSRSTRTARCRADKCCSAATNANRTDSRDPTIVDGSVASSGSGSSHGTSSRAVMSSSGSELGAPRPVGSGRRCLLSSAVRQVFVAMRYSHVRTEDLPSNVAYDFHARK
jgi:hypothetical protein